MKEKTCDVLLCDDVYHNNNKIKAKCFFEDSLFLDLINRFSLISIYIYFKPLHLGWHHKGGREAYHQAILSKLSFHFIGEG